ncbi:glutamate--tRNA ligase [Kineosporia sp. R_H_3]|uniref:glutamate--tRNA ligase n=1 Tax=Kineosporia sp. R_H_3 TaxID=1961848 RepID=UPI000B4AB82A|nr:glutamate--tRNA ligase [Kineosporia sp. R_H_3]
MSSLRSAPDAPVTTASGADVRVRFCPSPTGTPHVGLVRTALFNWAYARHTGGTFVFRIEDTDAARDSEESYEQILDALRWLGIDWDEGVEVGGPHEPYRQSRRKDLYADVVGKLVASGYVYESFSSPEEVEARHLAAGRDPKLGYDGHDRDLTEEERAAFRAQGREPVLRLRMPDDDLTFDDLVRGPVTFKAGTVPDFVVVRAGGEPLYTLVNPVDDALMGITHVLRGEDLLSSTPRQIALYRALVAIGVTTSVPRFGHLPMVLGEGTRKLSKRDPQSNLFHHRDRGFVPEGLLNYLALLGWSIAEDRDVFSMAEMTQAFDITDVNGNPARFDQAKADAINAEHLRLLAPEDFAGRLVAYLAAQGVVATAPDGAPDGAQRAVVEAAAPLVQTRVQVLAEAVPMVAFLLTADGDLVVEDDALATVTKDGAQSAAVLDAATSALGALPAFTAADIEAALRTAVVEGLGIKPKFAFGPLRVAVTGRRVSPPLFESMEILGRDSTLARVAALRGRLGA